MTEDLHRTGPHRRSTDAPEGVCPVHDLFANGLTTSIKDIKDGVERIEAGMTAGKVNFGELNIRMDHVEKVVYGAVGLSLTAILAAILGLVLKGGGS